MNTKTEIFGITLLGCAVLVMGWDTGGRYFQQALIVLGGAVLGAVTALLRDDE